MEKTKGELLAEKLTRKKKNIYETASAGEKKAIGAFAEDYKYFLDNAKTERESVDFAVEAAEAKGYKPFDGKKKYKAGDKVYLVNRNGSIVLAHIGKKSLEEGIHLSAAHIDCPRLDLKQNPMYEKDGLCYFKTHYYGGIKKYQWTVTPLALHGVIIKSDGTKIKVRIGEEPGDPIFVITDLLPHLAAAQMKKPLFEAFTGEDLNVLIGSEPFEDEKVSEKVKLKILAMLNEKYGVTEEDFNTAELIFTPAAKACDIGFDRALIGGYGHDDRSNSFAALRGLLDLTATPDHTAAVILTDKEEIGSTGNTGLQASYYKHFVEKLCANAGADPIVCFQNTKCLSADVSTAYDPHYPDVVELQNVGKLHYGGIISKYTGSRGKSDTSDASAETVAYFKTLFDKNGVAWQTGELGKTDVGGGGTVAKYLAHLDIDVIDFGVGVLSMHAPFEVISKADLYMTYKAFNVFNKN